MGNGQVATGQTVPNGRLNQLVGDFGYLIIVAAIVGTGVWVKWGRADEFRALNKEVNAISINVVEVKGKVETVTTLLERTDADVKELRRHHMNGAGKKPYHTNH